MEITKKSSGNGEVTLEVKGKITAVEEEAFGAALDEAVSETDNLKLDFKDVSYLSSSGLRTLVSAKKQIDAKAANMSIINAGRDVREVFEMTGLADLFGIQ